MSARSYYIIAGLLFLVTIPMYIKIIQASREGNEAVRSATHDARHVTGPSAEPRSYRLPVATQYGATSVALLVSRGFVRGKHLPPGFACSSPDGYVISVTRQQGHRSIEPLMDNNQMLRCIHGVYGGNIR